MKYSKILFILIALFLITACNNEKKNRQVLIQQSDLLIHDGEIISYLGKETNIIIPSEYNDNGTIKPITIIGANSFAFSNIQNVKIPNTIEATKADIPNAIKNGKCFSAFFVPVEVKVALLVFKSTI